MEKLRWLYAIGRELDLSLLDGLTGVDGSSAFELCSSGPLQAVCSSVDAGSFSQEEIDRRAGDLDWLAGLGTRHHEVNQRLALQLPIMPLRAFTLFSSREAVEQFLDANNEAIGRALDRLGGRLEWTVTARLHPVEWPLAASRRLGDLIALENELSSATPGKRFLLQKKLEQERARAADRAEHALLDELAASLVAEVDGEIRIEGTSSHSPTPRIHLLAPATAAGQIEGMLSSLRPQYEPEGVALELSGPWPPYSFAGALDDV
jgi:hypothetical protein